MIHKLGTYLIRESGRGAVLTIPEIGLSALGVVKGDSVDMHMQDDAIIVTKAVKIDPIFSGIVESVRPK
jgi:antitoxin component of MazEF toxin-antitoxin module